MSHLKSGRNPGVLPEKIVDVPFILSELPRFSPAFAQLICNDVLWELAREILQTDSVVYHFSNVTRKPAYVGPNLSWHRDYPNEFICPKVAAKFFRMLIPLEAMVAENGCTAVIPGTHLVPDEEARNRKRDKNVDFSIDAAVDLNAEPGDVIALHSKVVHGGKENRSPLDRNLIVIQFGIETDDYLSRNTELFSGLNREQIAEQLSNSAIHENRP